jgi:hypothetical protein
MPERDVEPLFDAHIVWSCDCGAPIEDPDEAWCNACLALGPDPRTVCDCILSGDKAEDVPDQYHQISCARRRRYANARDGWPDDAE